MGSLWLPNEARLIQLKDLKRYEKWHGPSQEKANWCLAQPHRSFLKIDGFLPESSLRSWFTSML